MKHKTEMPETNEPRLVSRRTLVAAVAWGVPAVTILGATPAYAASFGRDYVLSRPQSVPESTGWTNPDNVKGIDDVTTYITSGPGTGDPLTVSDFQIPDKWQYLTNVTYVKLKVKWMVDSTTYGPTLQVVANYGGEHTTAIDNVPTTDRLHEFTVELKIDPTTIWTADRDTVLTNMTVEITPSAGDATKFSVDCAYLLIGYQWHL